MAETVAVNFRILPETVNKLDRLARDTFHGKGDMIDFLVDEAYKRMYPHNGSLMDILAPTDEKGDQS